MDVLIEKVELAKRLLSTDDEAVLFKIKDVLDTNEKDFWDYLPAHVKAGIERGRAQAAAGKLTANEEVIINMLSIYEPSNFLVG